jgi:hypothetical protein
MSALGGLPPAFRGHGGVGSREYCYSLAQSRTGRVDRFGVRVRLAPHGPQVVRVRRSLDLVGARPIVKRHARGGMLGSVHTPGQYGPVRLTTDGSAAIAPEVRPGRCEGIVPPNQRPF